MSERAAQPNHSRPLIISCLRHGKSSSCLLIPRPEGGGLIEVGGRERIGERGSGERMKRYPHSRVVSVRVACLLQSGTASSIPSPSSSLSFVLIRERLVRRLVYLVSPLRLVACLSSVLSPLHRLVGRLVLFVSSGVSFYPSCFPRSRSILIRLRLRLRFRSSCFVDEVMRERNEGEGIRRDEKNDET